MIYSTVFTVIALILFMINNVFSDLHGENRDKKQKNNQVPRVKGHKSFLWPCHVALSAGAYLKMTTSTGFLAMALTAGGLYSLYGRMILVALFFSWWGDLFLIRSKERVFLMGLVAFFIGHGLFASAFLIHGVDWKWIGIGTIVCIAPLSIVSTWLNPHLGTMRVPVHAYMAVISLMVICSIGAWGRGATPLVVIGAILFYLSDIFVARERFVTPNPWNRHLGLPLYYIAQILLSISIFHVNQAPG